MSLAFVQLAADNFNRANENPLANGVWTTFAAFASPLQIVSNVCEAVAPNGFGASQYTGIAWPNDQWAEIKVTALASGADLDVVLRCDSNFSNYLELDIQPNPIGVKVVKGVSGVTTTLGTFPAPSIGDIYRLAVLGTTWYLFQNGAQIGTGTIGATPASGSVIIVSSYSGAPSDATLDNFAGGSVSSVVPYSVPDCRVPPAGPNVSRTVQGTVTYDVQTSSNHIVPPTDSRAAGPPVDDRVAPNIPQNSRTPGTFGPGE